jgi:hypothetical protein
MLLGGPAGKINLTGWQTSNTIGQMATAEAAGRSTVTLGGPCTMKTRAAFVMVGLLTSARSGLDAVP